MTKLKTSTSTSTSTSILRNRDAVFFDKDDIKPDTTIYHLSRRNPVTTWKVISISSLYREKPEGKKNFSKAQKKKIFRRVNEVRHLQDRVILTSSTGQTKNLSVAYLCYSAIWRL